MMMKKNILVVSMATLLAILGLANAATVFNVDLNGYTYNEDAEEYAVDLTPYGQYDGNYPAGAFDDGINRWNVMVGGWGVRLNPTAIPTGVNWHLCKAILGWADINDVSFSVDGTGLWGDYAYPNGSNTPILSIIGGIDSAGANYSQGAFDLYLYTNRPSGYTIEALHPDGTSANYSVSLPGHDPNDPNFILNANYVVIENLNASDWINIAINSGRLCGMQLVSKGIKVPSVTSLSGTGGGVPGTDFSPTWASFAYEITNISTGPYLYQTTTMNLLAQTYAGEWLVYDMYVEDANYAGFYEINVAYCTMASNVTAGFQIDDGPIATVDLPSTGTWAYENGWSDFSDGRLYLSKGYHRLKVYIGGGVNVWGYRIRRATDQTVSTCMDAQLKGSDLLPSDLNADCITNFKDLAEFASEWLNKCAGCP